MAIQNSVPIVTTSGLIIPADNVIISAVHFPKPTLNFDAEGRYDGTVTRYITYDLMPYASKESIQAGDNFIQGSFQLIPSGWQKKMTPQEYAQVLSKGEIAEVWLRDYIQGLIGGTSTIIDPYTI